MAATQPFHFLLPGEIGVYERPAVISTVLGSCVAITLHSPGRGIGGICHAMLPLGGEKGNFKYVDRALEHLLERFGRFGVVVSQLQVKVFGGSDMFGTEGDRPLSNSIGAKNVEAALGMLDRLGLVPLAADVRGSCGRKLFFLSHTGDVYLRVLNNSVGSTVPRSLLSTVMIPQKAS